MSNIIHILFLKDNEAIALFGIIVIFFVIVAFREAIKNDRLKREGKWPPEEQSGKDKVLAWPFLVRKEFLVAIFVMMGVLIWGIVRNAPLEEFANANVTPNPSEGSLVFPRIAGNVGLFRSVDSRSSFSLLDYSRPDGHSVH